MGKIMKFAFNGGAYTGLTKTLKEQGHTIIKTPNWLVQAQNPKTRKQYNNRLKTVIQREKPDVYICFKGFRNGPCVFPETTKFISKHAGITIYMCYDDPFFIPTFLQYGMAAGYQIALTCAQEAFATYRGLGITPYLYWPAFDPEIRKPIEVKEEDKIDFIFVGTPYMSTDVPRRAIATKFAEAGMSMELYGSKDWVSDKIIKHHKLGNFIGGNPKLRKYYKGTTSWPNVHNLYNRARLNLSNHVVRAQNYLNDRVPIVLGVGAFLFLDRNPGLDKTFKHKRHVVYYDDLTDLLRKAKYYKQHVNERNHIAKTGQDFILKHHTYYNRAWRLLEVLKKHGIT